MGECDLHSTFTHLQRFLHRWQRLPYTIVFTHIGTLMTQHQGTFWHSTSLFMDDFTSPEQWYQVSNVWYSLVSIVIIRIGNVWLFLWTHSVRQVTEWQVMYLSVGGGDEPEEEDAGLCCNEISVVMISSSSSSSTSVRLERPAFVAPSWSTQHWMTNLGPGDVMTLSTCVALHAVRVWCTAAAATAITWLE